MNCKPGDLAIVIKDARTAKLAGMMVEILHLAPTEPFDLPDGSRHLAAGPNQWVVKLSRPMLAPGLTRGIPDTRIARYGCIGDYYLRPLPGSDSLESEDEEECIPVTSTEEQS